MLRSVARVRVRSFTVLKHPCNPPFRAYAYPPEGVFQQQPNTSNPNARRTTNVPPPASDNQPVAYPGIAPEPSSAPASQPSAPDFGHPPPSYTSTPAAPPPPNPKKKHALFRIARTLFLLYAGAYIAFTVYDTVQEQALSHFSTPFEPNSPEDLEQLRGLQEEFDDLPLVRILRSYMIHKDGEYTRRFKEWDAYQGIRHDAREQRLTTGPLQGSGGIGAQKIFHDELSGAVLCFINFGEATGGWPGTVHGGLITTLFDETLGRCAFRLTEHQTGVTAKLKVAFVDKVKVGEWYVLMACPTPDAQSTPNKIFVSGAMFNTRLDDDLEPEVKISGGIPHLARVHGSSSSPPLNVGTPHVDLVRKAQSKGSFNTGLLTAESGRASALNPFYTHALADAIFVVPKNMELTPIKEDF